MFVKLIFHFHTTDRDCNVCIMFVLQLSLLMAMNKNDDIPDNKGRPRLVVLYILFQFCTRCLGTAVTGSVTSDTGTPCVFLFICSFQLGIV